MRLLESCGRGRYIATMPFLWVFKNGLSEQRLLCCLLLSGYCAWPHGPVYDVVFAQAPPLMLANATACQGCGQVKAIATLSLSGSCTWPSRVDAHVEA